MKTRLLFVSAVVFLCSRFISANDPPVVNAGPDTTLILGDYSSLRSQVTDDSLTVWELEYSWSQIGGPDSGAEILSPTTRNSGLEFSKPGVYLFELAVSDHRFTVRDTIQITVQKNVPLAMLKPEEGDTILKGATCTVTWEWEPVMDAILVYLSLDDGANFELLTDAPVTKGLTSWVWHVPDTLPDSDNCRLMVTDYFYKAHEGVSGRFSLVSRTGVTRPLRSVAARPRGPARVFSADGRHVGAGSQASRLSIHTTPSHRRIVPLY